MADPVMLDIDTENLHRLLTEPWTPEWEGTCELCGNGGLHLQHVVGCLMCKKCHDTITKRLKDTTHPFTDARVRMDPAYRGNGKPGCPRPLPPQSVRKQLVEAYLGSEHFERFVREKYPELAETLLLVGNGGT